MDERDVEKTFPFCLIISIPLPSHRLASSALRALRVDDELSPLVRRSFSLRLPETARSDFSSHGDHINDLFAITLGPPTRNGGKPETEESLTVLRTEYRATTNRMLRVAVNGFMESLGLVLAVMEELDVDVLFKLERD
ncbi:MAG: hypothetical protein MMC33_007929 [Icmadophila ericetorum]|nr:hypothetical protein [Icmadophila ericetorum]